MRTRVAVGAGALAASLYTAGKYFGFGSIPDHITFWLLAGLLFAAATRLAGAFGPWSGRADGIVRVGVISFALVVSCGLLLGATHLLTWPAVAVLEAVVLGVAIKVFPRGRVWGAGDPVPSAWPAGLLIAMAAFAVGMGISHSPFTLYDSVSYHLFFPARWLEAQHISIIPTPFSDEAQAYQPANGAIWFLWLMLPFHADFLARLGQFPFYLLAGAAACAISRRLGARAAHALYAPALVFVVPSAVDQGIGANVDLIFAAMFLTSIYLGILAVDRNSRGDWVLFGVSAGLFLGTKYLAIVYAPILLALAVVRGLRPRALWALPAIAALGLPWYLRNWAIAGSPIYPATFSIAGFTIGQGAYSHDAMLRTFMHTTDARLLAVSVVHAFGAPFFFVAAPAIGLAGVQIVRRRAWWPAAFLTAAAAAAVLLCWAGVGDNTDSRFVLPAVITVVALLPTAFAGGSRTQAAIHAVLLLGITWVLVGADARLPVAVPWFMSDWLSLHGVVAQPFFVWFIGLAGVAWLIVRLTAARGWALPAAAALVGAAGVTLAIGAETWCVPSRCDFLQVTSPHIRLNFLYGSRWLTANVPASTVAYTGINLPYALSGSHLQNTVYYVNIDRHADWRFHDYARALGRRPRTRLTDPAALARGSGILMPMAESGERFDAYRPRFERMTGDPDAWRANLRARGVGYLFVSTLDSYETEYVWHNAQGFPIEDDWARASPAAFQLVYDNPDVRIYRVTMP